MTDSKRQKRISSELQKAVSKIIFQDMNIPELKFVSVTSVKMSPDLSVATVYFSVISKEKLSEEEAVSLLRKNNRTIRGKISKYMKLRILPELRFFYDDTMDNVYRIEELLNSIKKNNNE